MGVRPRAKIHQIWYVFIIKCQNNCPEIWVTDITILTLLLDYVLIGCVTKLYTKTLRFLLFTQLPEVYLQKQPPEVSFTRKCFSSQNSQVKTCARVSFLIKFRIYYVFHSYPLTPILEIVKLTLAPTPQNGQTHLNNSSARVDELFKCVWPSCRVGA